MATKKTAPTGSLMRRSLVVAAMGAIVIGGVAMNELGSTATMRTVAYTTPDVPIDPYNQKYVQNLSGAVDDMQAQTDAIIAKANAYRGPDPGVYADATAAGREANALAGFNQQTQIRESVDRHQAAEATAVGSSYSHGS